jgi:hypothetical protein
VPSCSTDCHPLRQTLPKRRLTLRPPGMSG